MQGSWGFVTLTETLPGQQAILLPAPLCSTSVDCSKSFSQPLTGQSAVSTLYCTPVRLRWWALSSTNSETLHQACSLLNKGRGRHIPRWPCPQLASPYLRSFYPHCFRVSHSARPTGVSRPQSSRKAKVTGEELGGEYSEEDWPGDRSCAALGTGKGLQ